jgi:peptidoglycan/xylan/chitin deacetylase (PgdA/CDA1 family)
VMIRYYLAKPWLFGLRAARVFSRRKEPGFRSLLFHHVADEQRPAFDAFLRYLKKAHGVITPQQAEAFLSGDHKAISGNSDHRLPCLLTFDDGFSSNYTLATTILADNDVKALFFVCPELIDLKEKAQREAIATNIFDAKLTAKDLPDDLHLMSFQQVRSLSTMGHVIGAHTMTHRRLSSQNKGIVSHEVVGSKRRLEKELGRDVLWFAYPFGDIDSISADAMKIISDQFRFCRSAIRGVNDAETNPIAVRADHIDLSGPCSYRTLVLEGGLDGFYLKARGRLDRLCPPLGG